MLIRFFWPSSSNTYFFDPSVHCEVEFNLKCSLLMNFLFSSLMGVWPAAFTFLSSTTLWNTQLFHTRGQNLPSGLVPPEFASLQCQISANSKVKSEVRTCLPEVFPPHVIGCMLYCDPTLRFRTFIEWWYYRNRKLELVYS